MCLAHDSGNWKVVPLQAVFAGLCWAYVACDHCWWDWRLAGLGWSHPYIWLLAGGWWAPGCQGTSNLLVISSHLLAGQFGLLVTSGFQPQWKTARPQVPVSAVNLPISLSKSSRVSTSRLQVWWNRLHLLMGGTSTSHQKGVPDRCGKVMAIFAIYHKGLVCEKFSRLKNRWGISHGVMTGVYFLF